MNENAAARTFPTLSLAAQPSTEKGLAIVPRIGRTAGTIVPRFLLVYHAPAAFGPLEINVPFKFPTVLGLCREIRC